MYILDSAIMTNGLAEKNIRQYRTLLGHKKNIGQTEHFFGNTDQYEGKINCSIP